MAEYIEREALINSFRSCGASKDLIDSIVCRINLQEVVDAVPVVRCKDCAVPHNKYTGCPELNGLVTPPDFFCPFGEQKKGERRMKAIKKNTLLELARLTRKYVKTGDVDILSARIEKAKELSKQAYGKDNAWLPFTDFVNATVGVYALYPKCTNEELCELFRSLNFEVLDE